MVTNLTNLIDQCECSFVGSFPPSSHSGAQVPPFLSSLTALKEEKAQLHFNHLAPDVIHNTSLHSTDNNQAFSFIYMQGGLEAQSMTEESLPSNNSILWKRKYQSGGK